MKIAITSMGAKLEDKVDPRFGRCHYFIWQMSLFYII